MASRSSDDPNFVNAVKRAVNSLPPSVVSQLGFMLDLMSTHLGSIVSTGYWTTIPEQPLSVRTSILHSWQRSWFFLWPILARIFITLGKACWSQTNKRYLQLNGCENYGTDMVPGPAFDFKFMQFEESPEPAIVDTDVVIVGSGCGGAVCAKVLAEAGLRVFVTDKGYYFPPDQFPMALDRLGNIFQAGGGLASVDGSTFVTAGMCWGGGGTVNWCASLQTPSYIRQEWAEAGLDFFLEAEYQESLDRVCEAMGVSGSTIDENHSNKILREGSQKLNWKANSVPQNTGGASHSCGSNCGRGCRTGKKQSTSTYWLPAAARAGARFIEGFDVSNVLVQYGQAPKAVGVTGLWKSRRPDGIPDPSRPERQQLIEVRAKTVILAAGALNTPLVLQRSAIKNANIGKNLFLHPVINVAATWNEDVQPWKGDILSNVVTEFENLDGHGHGVKLESTVMQPYVAMVLFPWQSGAAYKAAALQYRNMTCHISLCRDREPGSVSPEPRDGSPVVNYSPSKFDRVHIITGVVAIAKLCYVSGARAIFPAVPGVSPFHCTKATANRTVQDEEFIGWIRTLENASLDPLKATFNSAHQMGTSRMGTNPETSVVDNTGKVWGYDGLYVADASVFPSANGVNPMITVMAIADRISRGIAAHIPI
ncbi:long-chain fatty alcohol dehydrogenase [Xylariaceae sp. FL1019]|nr:long-chain fatty alcohol dehydrogenase [Xylariaceae sp. FL1019]